MTRLFLDIDVILDVFARREPWYADSAAVLSLLGTDTVHGSVAAHSVTTLYDLTARELGHDRAVAALLTLLERVSVAPLDQDILLRALALGWDDVEDAVQSLSATRSGAEYLVTRSTSDFRDAEVTVMTPREVLPVLEGLLERKDDESAGGGV